MPTPRLPWTGLILLIALLVPQAAAQDVTILASVDRSTVGAEEILTYTVEVKGASFDDIRTPEPPPTEGLALVRPMPSVQRNMSIINGRLQQSLAFRWSYRPLRQGTARIGATRLTVQGQTHATEPIQVTVVPQAQRPDARRPYAGRRSAPAAPPADGAESESGIGEGDLFIRVVPSKREAYQNEQVTIEYQLFFRDGIQLRHSRLAGSWDAEGFWREEFEVDTRPIPRATVVDGLRYHTITLKRAAVFPTRAGDLTVDPLRIETEAYVPSRSADPFDRFFSPRNRFDTVRLSSSPVTIEALPLPAGAPATFNGAVGTFALHASVDRTEVEVGDPVQLTIRISGTGNLATLAAPALDLPGVFERYDPQVATQVERTGARIRGRKEFTYVLVPRSNGAFELPEVRFTHFDPSSRQYVTTASEPVAIRVTGDAAAPLAAGTTADGLPVDDIAGLMPGGGRWVPAETTPLHRQPWTYAALVLPWLAAAGVYGFRRHAARLATDSEYARGRIAHPEARRHLQRADALLARGRPRDFFQEIERAVLGFIGDRFDTTVHGLTRVRLEERLTELHIDSDTRRALLDLLERCDRARFAPDAPTPEDVAQARGQAAALIAAVDDAASRTAA